MNYRISNLKRLFIGVLIATTIIAATIFTLDRRKNTQSTAASNSDLVTGTAVGEIAPEFEGQTIDGESLKLSDLRGQVVVLNLFASWCGPCRLETPHLVGASQDLESGETAVVGLNLNESPQAVADFQAEFGIPYPLVMDPDGALTSDVYRPIGLPTTWFIDQEGVVRFVFSGAMTEELLLQIIDDVRAGREPDPFSQSS